MYWLIYECYRQFLEVSFIHFSPLTTQLITVGFPPQSSRTTSAQLKLFSLYSSRSLWLKQTAFSVFIHLTRSLWSTWHNWLLGLRGSFVFVFYCVTLSQMHSCLSFWPHVLKSLLYSHLFLPNHSMLRFLRASEYLSLPS